MSLSTNGANVPYDGCMDSLIDPHLKPGVSADAIPPYPSTVLQRVQQEFVPKVQGVQIHQNYLQMIQGFWPELEKAYRGQQTGEEAMKKAGEVINGLINPS